MSHSFETEAGPLEDTEQFVSVSHILPPEEGSEDDLALKIFSVPTGEIGTIRAVDETTAHIYRGIFEGLRLPGTKANIIAGLDLENEEVTEFAGKVFDALDDGGAITAVSGLAKTLAPTWQNPPVYGAPGYRFAEQAEQARQPYTVAAGDKSYDFTATPSFERATTRSFDSTAPIDYDDLQKILVDSYRTSEEGKRPTPSPGGIYPVRIHVINGGEGRIRDASGEPAVEAGIYQYDPLNLGLERQQTAGGADRDVLEYLTQDADAGDPAVWLMLSVDTEAFEQKYGNASQMFTGVCIGSAMQRIIEEADHAGYGTLPLFGIRHHYSDELLGNADGVNTVLAIGVGRPAETDTGMSRKSEIATTLSRVQVGTKDMVATSPVKFGGAMPARFTGVSAQYPQKLSTGEVVQSHAFGTASTVEEASLKATAEAVERMASSNVRIDIGETAADALDAPWLDPRRVLPLDNEQLAITRTVPFNAQKAVDWTAGIRMGDGSKIYAPSSLIYYPYADSADPVARNTSSGIAAHFDKAEASQRGLLELIERDAIMRTWITQQSPSMIDTATLPDAVAYRMQQAAAMGNKLDILNITQENGVPVYMATVRGSTFPHLYAGAAANFDPETAMHKALDEAVAGYGSWATHEVALRAAEANKRETGVFDPSSHGMLYAEDAQARADINWLFEGAITAMPDTTSIPTPEAVVARYNPAVFEMDNPIEGNELKIVRVIAEDLVPITFGEAGVTYMHHTLPQGPPPTRPHFFN